jgi:hypothetical protein
MHHRLSSGPPLPGGAGLGSTVGQPAKNILKGGWYGYIWEKTVFSGKLSKCTMTLKVEKIIENNR